MLGLGPNVHRILVVADTRSRREDFVSRLGDLFEIDFHKLPAVFDLAPVQHMLVDIELGNDTHLLRLKEWLKRKSKDAKVIFVTDKTSRLQEARAYALGATGTIHNPIGGQSLLAKFRDDDETPITMSPPGEGQLTPSVAVATDALENIFSAASSGAPVDSAAVRTASDVIVDQLERQGLASWIETVRMHHSQTYQHCLLVTGLAGAFGQHIGVSRKDRQRLSYAGMLHDIGKARIPLAILEKPGRLDDNEFAVMRKHPEYGLEALGTASGVPAEMLDMVVHHHELLDGSGYPHGLSGSEISDLVRMMTISDVFGALIEKRSYKPPLSGEAAYQILLDMGPKLDKDLVRAFKFAARVDQSAAA
jgi:putative nucleotidyltransferase with HDIG domain